MDDSETSETVWLAPEYHMAAPYSCRIPVSSQNAVLSAPAPGPATVRLALVSTGIEWFGFESTREVYFPIIRSAVILVRPPARVGISTQLQHAFKVSQKSSFLQDSLAYREMCQADGPITIYIQIPSRYDDDFRKLFRSIGYWGQSNSPAFCNSISNSIPDKNECAQPLTSLIGSLPLGQFFGCIVSEFRKPDVTWEEIMPDRTGSKNDFLKPELYIWPMRVIEQQSKHKLLQRCSLDEGADFY